MTEEWRPVAGYEGLYEVSDQGRVRSLDRLLTQAGRNGTIYTKTMRGRVLRPGSMPAGHQSVVLTKAGGSKCVHALVLAAFVGPCPEGAEARHLNGDPGDNRLVNLAYGSRRENGQDKKWHNGAATYRLRPAQIREIKLALKARRPGAVLAKQYGVAQSTISAIKHNKFHRDVHV